MESSYNILKFLILLMFIDFGIVAIEYKQECHKHSCMWLLLHKHMQFLGQWFLTKSNSLPPSRDIWQCLMIFMYLWHLERVVTTGIQWVENRDLEKYPLVKSQPPQTKIILSKTSTTIQLNNLLQGIYLERLAIQQIKSFILYSFSLPCDHYNFHFFRKKMNQY